MKTFMRFTGIAAVVVCLDACGSPDAPPEEESSGYVIDIGRVWPQGQRFREQTSYSGEISISAFQGNRTLEDTSRRAKYRFDADVEVLKTSASGSATKLRYTIQSMSGSSDGSAVRTLDPESVVVAEAVGRTLLHPEFPPGLKTEIESDIKGLLSAQFDDELAFRRRLNPPGRVEIGETWNVDGDAALTLLGADEFVGDAAQVTAWARLDDVYLRDGIEMCRVVAFIDIDNKGAEVPPGTTLNKATITSTVTLEMPLDPALPLWRQDQTFSVFADASGGGGKFLSTITIDTKTKFEYE